MRKRFFFILKAPVYVFVSGADFRFSRRFCFSLYACVRCILSSLIQTILSVPELHRIGCFSQFADCTAGGELRPAPKNNYFIFT